jgi:hypothetical protein
VITFSSIAFWHILIPLRGGAIEFVDGGGNSEYFLQDDDERSKEETCRNRKLLVLLFLGATKKPKLVDGKEDRSNNEKMRLLIFDMRYIT